MSTSSQAWCDLQTAKPDKRNYRRFRIKTAPGQDDFASINEIVTRRYKRLLDEKASLPDLIIVDGGHGQVSAAKKALQKLGLQLPLIGLAKEREEIYLPDDALPHKFDSKSRMMLLVRQIRDATHGYALGYNKKRREMKIRNEFQPELGGKSEKGGFDKISLNSEMVSTVNITFICDLKDNPKTGEKRLGCRRVCAKTEVSDEGDYSAVKKYYS